MIAEITHQVVDAAADIGVRNSQPEGIGRLVVLGDLLCWNNLGRNVVFADRRLRPRAVFGSTLYPDEDEPSQYDLDVHAILEESAMGCVLVLNHLGTIRGFRSADLLGRRGPHAVAPTMLWSFSADVERTVLAGRRLIGSRPRSERGDGLLVSAPLDTLPEHGSIPTQRDGERFGDVTALGVVPAPGGPLIAVGGDGTVALAPLAGDHLASPRWEADVGFRVAALEWHRDALWAAGPERAGPVDDYDWERLEGGGFAALDPVEGTTLVSGPLPRDVAWGTGGVAVMPFGRLLAAAGRTGGLSLIDPRHPASGWSTDPLSATSLGIAHMAVAGRRVVYGFNRGGYCLHSAAPRTA
ncbi:MAG TPA: hypothetical protein VF942_11830 [Acidimicrobiales bacterium]